MNREIARHFEEIFDLLGEGVFITDTEGYALYINAMYCTLTGLQKEKILGKKVYDLQREGLYDYILHPDIVTTLAPARHIQHVRNGPELVLYGYPVFDENRKLCLVVTFVRDITILGEMNDQISEQRKLINQLVRNPEQDSLLREPIYSSPAIAKILDLLHRFAKTDATVLILGETGTGKDVFARFIHDASPRNKEIFLKVDCGGIAESLIESELFGYTPGSFTGASRMGKAGYFEMANKGTVFLDEIAELSPPMQTRLLRVLQEKKITRVGTIDSHAVDVRIIAATNRNLTEEIKAGRFRQDLFYRLNVASVTIPPLRERREDIQPLLNYFIGRYTAKYHKKLAFPDVTIDRLVNYEWPGNVRELQNLVHSLVIALNAPLVFPGDLPRHIANIKAPEAPAISFDHNEVIAAKRSFREIMEEAEYSFLQDALDVHGSIQKVADLFHIDRSTIFRKIQHYKKNLAEKEKTSG